LTCTDLRSLRRARHGTGEVHRGRIPADDSPRLRYALESCTGLNRAATRRWLRGEATREATHELLASTLEHVLRTCGGPTRAKPAHISFLTGEPSSSTPGRGDAAGRPTREATIASACLRASLKASARATGMDDQQACAGTQSTLSPVLDLWRSDGGLRAGQPFSRLAD
jgi:hypothetical protein